MKKYIFLFTITFCFLTKFGFTQENPFVFGVKIAPNMGWMKPNPSTFQNKGSDIGFSWGLIAEFYLMENYAINTGLNISYLNATLEYPETVNNEDGILNRAFRLKYLEVPITFKMRTNDFNRFSYFGIFGFGTGFKLSAKANDIFTSSGGNNINSEDDISNDVKSIRVSMILGIGMEYILGGNNKILIGLNFNNGFSNVLKNQNVSDPSIDYKAINNYFEMYLAILF